MNKIFRAFRQAFRSCWDPSVLMLLFVPFLLGLLISGILFFTFGTLWVSHWSETLGHSMVMEYLTQKWALVKDSTAVSFSYFVLVIFVLLILLPLSYLLAVILVSLFLMPLVIKKVQRQKFPHLEKKFGGNLAENLWNTLKTSVIYVFLLVLTLPLWFIPGAMIGIPVMLGGYMSQKIFVYDVLQDFASAEERRRIEKDNKFWLFLLGILLALMNFLPLAFIVTPVFAGLTFSFFCLNELQELRQTEQKSETSY